MAVSYAQVFLVVIADTVPCDCVANQVKPYLLINQTYGTMQL